MWYNVYVNPPAYQIEVTPAAHGSGMPHIKTDFPRYAEPVITEQVLSADDAIPQLKESAKTAFAAEHKPIVILKRGFAGMIHSQCCDPALGLSPEGVR